MSNWSSYPEQQNLHELFREFIGRRRFNRMGGRSAFIEVLNNVKGSRSLSDFKRFYKEALETLETLGEISHRDVTDYEERLETIIATYERYKDDDSVLGTYFGDGRTDFGSQLKNLFTLTQESNFIKQVLFNLLRKEFPPGGGRGGRGGRGKTPSPIKTIVDKFDEHFGLDLDKGDKKKLRRAINKDLRALRGGASFGTLALQEAAPPPPETFPNTRAELQRHGLNDPALDVAVNALKNKFSSLISSSTGTSSTGTSSTGTSSTGTSPPPPGSLTATIDDLSTFIGQVEQGLDLITTFRGDRTLQNLRNLVNFFETLSTPPAPPPVTEEKTKGKPKPNSVKIEEFLDEMKKQIKSFIETFKEPNEEELNGEEINNFLDFFEDNIKNGKKAVDKYKKQSGEDSSTEEESQKKSDKATANGAKKQEGHDYVISNFIEQNLPIIKNLYVAFERSADDNSLSSIKKYFNNLKQKLQENKNLAPNPVPAFKEALSSTITWIDKTNLDNKQKIIQLMKSWVNGLTELQNFYNKKVQQSFTNFIENMENIIKIIHTQQPQNQQNQPEDKGTKGAQPAVANSPQQMDKLAANAGPNSGKEIKKENLQEQQLKVRWKLLAGIK